MSKDQIEQDLELIRAVDDADYDFPYGVGDWLEQCLEQLADGKPLSDRSRLRAQKMLRLAERHRDDY